MNEIFIRRSIRKFSKRPIKETTLDTIIKAGMQAPSARNQRPWEFLIIRDQKMKSKLSQVSQYAKMLPDADTAIILLANMENLTSPQYWQQDMSACTQNILLQATSENLGSVWLGVAPKIERINFIVELFDLPEMITPFAIVALGHPLEQKNTFIDRNEPEKVQYEKYVR